MIVNEGHIEIGMRVIGVGDETGIDHVIVIYLFRGEIEVGVLVLELENHLL